MKELHLEQLRAIEEMAAREKEKKFIQAVEALPNSVGAHDKAHMLLIYKGLRPAMVLPLEIFSLPPGAEDRDPAVDELAVYNQIRSVCSEFGIVAEPAYNRFFPTHDGGEFFCQYLVIAGNQGTADQFMKPWKKFLLSNKGETDPEDERFIGYLMGFPPTAVNAYSKLAYDSNPDNRRKLLFDTESLPDDIKQQDYMAFATLVLSKKNWQNELKIIKSWAKEVKRMSPSIFDAVVDFYRKFLEESQRVEKKNEAA